MDGIFDRVYGLSRRGGTGLAYDKRGVALGLVALVEALERGGRRVYRLRPSEEIAHTLALAYDPFTADDLARRLAGLDVAARALEAGELAFAGIATLLLKLPALSSEAAAKLMAEPMLRKYSTDQPRDAQGRWTDEGGDTGGAAPVQVAANDTGVMSDAGGVLPASAAPPPPGTGNVREYSPEHAAKLPPPPSGSKYVTLHDGAVLWSKWSNHERGSPMLRVTGEFLHLVDIDGYADVDLSVDAARRLVVTLPATIELSGKRDSFDGVPVTYEFHSDNPGDAKRYRRWLDHHNDPQAVAWYRGKGWSPYYCEPR